MNPLHLFEKFGIELEYTIVRRDDYSVASLTDQIMIARCGEPLNNCELGPCAVSNELAAHVFELKTPEPVADLGQAEDDFATSIAMADEILATHNALLLPGAMHPTMNPAVEARTWPHGNREIYETYDRIFDCRGHGWFNLQSCHLNLPFAGDDEFARLHSAILPLLPLMPALAAGSPFREGKITGLANTRLDAYRSNQARVPLIAGEIIPEPVFSRSEYEEKILAPMYEQIRPLDTENILQEEWLNSRGAIARFERNAIEIRLLDVQECPAADIALCAFFIRCLRELAEQPPARLRTWALASPAALRKEQLLAVIRDGEDAPLLLPELREIFPGSQACRTAGEFWRFLYRSEIGKNLPARHRAALETILFSGTLATRLVAFQENQSRPDDFRPLLETLAHCLRENQMLPCLRASVS